MKLPLELVCLIIEQSGNYKFVIPFYNILSRSSKIFLYKTFNILDENDNLKNLKIIINLNIFIDEIFIMGWCAENGKIDIFIYFYKNFINLNTDKYLCSKHLKSSSKNGHLDIVKSIFSTGWYDHDSILWSLFYSRSRGNHNVTMFLETKL